MVLKGQHYDTSYQNYLGLGFRCCLFLLRFRGRCVGRHVSLLFSRRGRRRIGSRCGLFVSNMSQ